MVKFTLQVTTPFEEYNRTYYAKSKAAAEARAIQWSQELNGTGRTVKLLKVEPTDETLPPHHTCW